jgi:glycosyltransferase involved in cell wall biosynthesis
MPTAIEVSVVVPARNEEATLSALLDSLVRQTCPADEIVVVDGGSTDATAAVAAEYADHGVVVLRIGPAYPGRGRNEGAAAARCGWIAFIDAGCRADPGWLEALVDELRTDRARPDAVFGSVRAELNTEWECAQVLTYVPPVDPQTGCRPPFIASSLINRSAFEAAGRFPEDLRAAEDLVFFERLARAGVRSVRAPRAVVTWQLPPGPGMVFRRFRLYSAHHLAAGLSRTWHLRVVLMDLTGLALLVGALFTPVALLAFAGAVLVRAAKAVWVRRANISPRFAFRPDRLFRVLLLVFLCDLALWAGLLDYACARARTTRGTRG